jgi:hypothetical protein
MNIEELAAWLNPQTIRYDTGRGGIPTITPQDVAAALGVARGKEPLGVEIILQRSAPDLAATNAKTRRQMLVDLVIREHTRRQRALIVAGEAKLTAELRAEFRQASRLEVSAARQKHEEARAAAWPKLGGQWARLIDLVDREMASHGRCRTCDGTGEIWVQTAAGLDARAMCKRCGGTGVEPVSGRKRSEMVGITEATWRQCWQQPHDWLFAECERARLNARRIAGRALWGEREEAA